MDHSPSRKTQIRAGISKSLETSDHTSIQRRIESNTTKPAKSASASGTGAKAASPVVPSATRRDSLLAPLPLNERSGPIGPVPNRTTGRCSDKWFMPLTLDQYVEVLNWTARQLPRLKRGWSIQAAPPVFAQCPLSPQVWCQLAREFGKLFCHVAGQAQTVDATRSRLGHNRYYLKRPARDLLTRDASQTAGSDLILRFCDGPQKTRLAVFFNSIPTMHMAGYCLWPFTVERQ